MDKRCLLVTANGDGTRMRKYFNLPKHHLYFHQKRIIDHIVDSAKEARMKCFVASKYEETGDHRETLYCKETPNRIETLRECLKQIPSKYTTIIVNDCDVIFSVNQLFQMTGNSVAVGINPGDGLKYGFIHVHGSLEYVIGYEKQNPGPFITTGLYSFNRTEFTAWLDHLAGTGSTVDSLLGYYNMFIPKLIYTQSHYNLGDIEAYFNNLW